MKLEDSVQKLIVKGLIFILSQSVMFIPVSILIYMSQDYNNFWIYIPLVIGSIIEFETLF